MNPKRLFLFLTCLVFLVVLVRTAWMSDDAFITLRTVDNFVHGYGLTWNVAERVQAYTHPLWMFLLTGLYVFTHEAYFTTIFLSIVVSFLAVLVFGFRIPRTAGAALFGLAGLIFSRAYIDYSTSGLEGPLSHLVIVLFFLVYLRWETTDRKIFWLALLASAAALTRLDLIVLLFLPLGQVTLLALRGKRCYRLLPFRNILLGFTPLLAWELFSIIYYGFPFPNTAYAKLAHGFPQDAILSQGLQYFFNSLANDPLTLLLTATALLVSFVGYAPRQTNSLQPKPQIPLRWRFSNQWPIAAGILLYLGYIAWIGGDFMSGRFLTAPYLAAVILFSQLVLSPPRWVFATVVVILLGLASPFPTIFSDACYRVNETSFWTIIGQDGIADERGFYYHGTGLLRQVPGGVHPDYPWAYEGLSLRTSGIKVTTKTSIGMAGYFAGPGVYIVDVYALADPLLARLPAKPDMHWRIGHFERAIPCGYLETLVSGENRLCDPALAAYYDKLALITRGKLWDSRRLVEIFNRLLHD